MVVKTAIVPSIFDSSNLRTSPSLKGTLFSGIYVIWESLILSAYIATAPESAPVILSPITKSEVFAVGPFNAEIVILGAEAAPVSVDS